MAGGLRRSNRHTPDDPILPSRPSTRFLRGNEATSLYRLGRASLKKRSRVRDGFF